MAERGFFEELLHDFLLFTAVEKTKDKNGVPNRAAAHAFASSLDDASIEDFAKVEAIMEMESDSAASVHSSNPYVEALASTGLYNKEKFEDTFVGNNFVFANDMELLHDAGYDALDLELMDPDELRDAMEEAGVDTMYYDFDD